MITSSPARRRICSWVLLTSSAVSSVERTRAKSSPLYSGDDFALVRSTLDTAEEVSKTQEQIRLRAGDEVIITAYDLYDGKVIGS